jgi:hypothetical protein
VVLLAGGALDPPGRRWVYVRGAATLFMVITGIVYAVLLANVEVGLTSPWINDTLHRVIPLVMLADWIVFPPWARRSYRAALSWLVVPLAYFAYSLLRGAAVYPYPYPFLNPTHSGGYGRVVIYAVVLAVFMGLLAFAVNAVARGESGNPRSEPRVSTPGAGPLSPAAFPDVPIATPVPAAPPSPPAETLRGRSGTLHRDAADPPRRPDPPQSLSPQPLHYSRAHTVLSHEPGTGRMPVVAQGPRVVITKTSQSPQTVKSSRSWETSTR